MTRAIEPAKQAALTISQRSLNFARASKSARTIKAYQIAWQDFSEYCQDNRVTALPAAPVTVINYLGELSRNLKVSTIQVRLAAIAEAHRFAHQPDPTTDADVVTVMAGIRRQLGTAVKKKTPVLRDDLKRMVNKLPPGLTGTRDRALLLVGWAGAFRRSELVALDIADVRAVGNSKYTITLRRSKTDQEGKGLVKTLVALDDAALCPVRALRAWLTASGLQSGALFRKIDRHGYVHDRLSDRSVALIVKRSAQRAGLDDVNLAGHSLRSGFITEAASAGVESRDIMAQTGHRSEAVMRDYIQDAGHGAAKAVRGAFGERK